MLDLDYPEDSKAEVDFNVVGTDAGTYVELQGTAEGKPFDRAGVDALLDLAGSGLERLFAMQGEAIASLSAVTRAGPDRRSRPTRSTRHRSCASCWPAWTPSSSRWPTSGSPTDVPEDGATFEDERARQGARLRGADRAADAGRRLGARGRRARRWARASGRGATPASTPPTRENNAKLLDALRGCRPNGAARDTCASSRWPSRAPTARSR